MSTLPRMDRENKPWVGQPRTWWLAIILLAGLVYFMGVAHESIWFREPITFSGPFAQAGVTVTKYVYTSVVTAPTSGKLNLHITGLRPPGNLLIALFNDEASYPVQPSSVVFPGFSDNEMIYTFDGLSFGDYVIYVFHDENYNKAPDMDSRTGLFSEGYGWANMDKVDLRSVESVREGTSFNDIKYAFVEDGQTVEIKIYYSPFPWQKE